MTARVERYAREEGSSRDASLPEVLGRSRLKHIVAARHAVMRRLSADGFSTTQIGLWLNRDHSTIVHALRKSA